MISKRGKACLSDFGFSKVLEEVGNSFESRFCPTLKFTSQSENGASSLTDSNTSRWSAPELMQPVLIGLSKVFASTSTDVWSFGMLCLELMTGCQPYNDVDNDITVAINLSKWQLPPRPGPMVTEQGLTDDLWALMLKCWHKNPHQRPTMTEVKDKIKKIRDNFTVPPRPGNIIRSCVFVLLHSRVTSPTYPYHRSNCHSFASPYNVRITS